jgi:DHA1 family bicyclomycin/chloramphenicol resistance-like MFS transporter
MISPMAITIIVPSMPGLQAAFHADYSTVQLTLSLYLAAIAVAQPFVGLLSDRFGRRPVLLTGLSLFVVSSLLAVAAPNIESIIFLRVLQGAGGCTGMILGRAIIRDLYDRQQAASMIGYVTMAFAVAPMAAPSIGGLLQETYGWAAIYWFLGLFGLACLIFAWLDVSETNMNPTDSFGIASMLRDFRSLLGEPEFRLYATSGTLASAVFFAFIGGVPFVSEVILKLSPTTYGLWFALTALGYSVGNFISGRFAQRLGIFRLIYAGAWLMLLPILLLIGLFGAGLGSAPAMFIPMFFVGMANGLCLPGAIAGAISVRPDIAGAASGLMGSLQTGVGALFSAVAGALLAGGMSAMPLFFIMASAAVASLICATIVRRIAT